ncbi:hypothetical protein [Motilimonas eburnea]|uniref:hypothetical protein n=1 Tax=Motilimonas eburnea TaxID=1737488 RepID=UPI001E365FCC|nr:hypothetical protein [Motilimonas eburnea]MCE2571852.1 hypothetical protein [Motilimonas eburnea]
MKVQNYMLTADVEVICPHCGSLESGFVGNPAGGEFVCDSCGQPYQVHKEADIEFK